MESIERETGHIEIPTTREAGSRRGGCLPFLAAVAVWLFLLHDFVKTPVAILLAIAGAALLFGGLYLSLAGARHVFESQWYAGAWLLGLSMLAAAAATLAPAAPGVLLTETAVGWKLLEARARQVEQAIENRDVQLAGKIARRGLGDPSARGAFGIPLLHLAKDPEMLETLLEAGLDPDAEDAEGRTFLMKAADGEIRQRLLDAGGDLEAGHRLSVAVATRSGRDDWLVVAGAAATAGVASGVSLMPAPLHPGEVGTVTIVIDNAGGNDRLLDLRAELDNGVLFVSASHDGAVADLRFPGLTSTVRWPPLALPAGGRGELEMRVLARPDNVIPGLPTGDLAVDVRVVDLPQRSEEVLQLYQQRAGDAARDDISRPMPIALLIVPLVLALALWVAGRRVGAPYSDGRHFRLGRAVAAASALACAAIASLLAWSMIEPYLRFDPAPCRVVDRRIVFSEVEGDSGSSRLRRASERVLQVHPVAAVEIDLGDEVLVAAGFSTGMGTRSVQELRMLPINNETTCWLDPRVPRRFTLVRRPSLGGGIGLAMLLVLTVVLSLITTRLGRGAKLEGG